MSAQIAVVDVPARSRYEVTVDGQPAGLLSYRLADGVITFLHEEIDPAREGAGLGSALARHALDDARARGLSVRPLCPFVADFIERHSEYADLVRSGSPMS